MLYGQLSLTLLKYRKHLKNLIKIMQKKYLAFYKHCHKNFKIHCCVFISSSSYRFLLFQFYKTELQKLEKNNF